MTTEPTLDLPRVLNFAHRLLYLAHLHGGSVTSWYRTEKHNAQVGGVPHSKHLRGVAADVVLDDRTQRPSFTRMAGALNLTVLDEKTHLHVHANE